MFRVTGALPVTVTVASLLLPSVIWRAMVSPVPVPLTDRLRLNALPKARVPVLSSVPLPWLLEMVALLASTVTGLTSVMPLAMSSTDTPVRSSIAEPLAASAWVSFSVPATSGAPAVPTRVLPP